MRDLLWAVLLGVVEGVTEFLPVSSTGHLLLCEQLMGERDPARIAFWKAFTIFIQIGAIAAVVVYFRRRIVELLTRGRDPAAPPGPSPLMAVVVGTVPVLAIGFVLHKWVEAHLERPRPIAVALGLGGLVMLWVEQLRPPARTESIERLTWRQAIGVGFVQVLAAVFPGTSRSAATIVGGLGLGLSRPAAAEFSFFLAIPAMAAACGFSLLKWALARLKQHAPAGELAREAAVMAVGTAVSFVVAWVVIAAFMGYVRRHSFVPFALYRMALCLVVLWLVR
jgi:undecaprenyl-diphosphatase